MIGYRLLAIATIIGSAIFIDACGGGSHGAFNSPTAVAPTEPVAIAGNAGDGAVSLGWQAPDTGTQPLSYNIAIAPTATNATVTLSGTHAIILGLSNDTTYTFSVTAKNKVGESNAVTLPLRPTAINDTNFSDFTALDSTGLNNASGIYDPAVLNAAGSIWMAYSSVDYYQQAGHRVQDVSTSLAFSNDGGASYAYLRTIGTATNVTITLTSNNVGGNPCGSNSCSGRWVYEVPFLVDDSSDPDASRRFKLFAHKYFLYPAAADPSKSTFYALGAIVMWTAASPGSSWSSEQVVLSWNSTPLPLTATNNINALDPALSECLALSEGSATNFQGALDLVFACSNGTTQKIVLLRSSDHAATFKYIGTPLTAADAASIDAQYLYFSAPALIPTETSAPLLIATPVTNRAITGISPSPDAYSGCIVFPFADEETGSLFRSNGKPLSIVQLKYETNHLNGACAWDRGVTGSGILINDYDASVSMPFRILKTAKNL